MEQQTNLRSSCIRCGICIDVCPFGIIRMGEERAIHYLPQACNACGHCVAVCPQAALDNEKTPLEKQENLKQIPVIDASVAKEFLRSRRSVRNYKNETVPRETILKLLDIARYAPTGGNSQGISYLVIDHPEILKQVITLTVNWMAACIASGMDWIKPYTGYVEDYRKNSVDRILRNAPCLVLATAPKGFSMGHDNSRFTLEYVELYATTLGLGTCWAGFVELCAGANYLPMLELLKIPEELSVVGAMLVGYPKYRFHRLVERNPLNVSFI